MIHVWTPPPPPPPPHQPDTGSIISPAEGYDLPGDTDFDIFIFVDLITEQRSIIFKNYFITVLVHHNF